MLQANGRRAAAAPMFARRTTGQSTVPQDRPGGPGGMHATIRSNSAMASPETVNTASSVMSDYQPHLYVCDRSGTCVHASPLVCLQGQKLTCPEGRVWHAHGLPATLGKRLHGSLDAVLESGEIVRVLIRENADKGRARASYACRFMPVDLNGDDRGVAVSIRHLSAAPAEPGNLLSREMLDRLPTPTVSIRVSDWQCQYANPAAGALFGRKSEHLLERSLAAHFERVADADRILEHLVVDGQVADYESVIVDGCGNPHCVSISGGCAFSRGSQAALLTITPTPAPRGSPLAAERDALTGLLNRNALADRLRTAIRRAMPVNRMVAALFIDLNRFKEVNDNHGHRTGDELLAVIAMRLAGCVRRYESLGRLGGDEFVVIVEDLTESGDALRVRRDIQRVISQPVEIRGRLLSLSASIGISFYPFDAEDADELLHAADQAMYREKGVSAKREY